MFEILHVVVIYNSIDAVFEALTDPHKIKKWWSSEVYCENELGGLIMLKVINASPIKFRITQRKPPSYLEWTCVLEEELKEWANTVVEFHITSTEEKGVQVLFKHRFWAQATQFFAKCNFEWARHLHLLKVFCETGSTPFNPQNEMFMFEKPANYTRQTADGVVNIDEKLDFFKEHWSPHIIAELNGQHVKLAKLFGEFVWHQHENEDEMFLVLKGELIIEFRDKTLVLNPGELCVVPRGVEHKPIAKEEVSVMLFEPASTINTGDNEGELTRKTLKKI